VADDDHDPLRAMAGDQGVRDDDELAKSNVREHAFYEDDDAKAKAAAAAAEEKQKVEYEITDDHRLLLRSAYQLLNSRSCSVRDR